MTGVYSTSAMNMEVKTETAIRCSIILLAGSNFSRLNVYILCLSEMKLSEDYEIIVINDHEMEINEGLLRAFLFLPSLKVLSLGGFLRQEKLFNKAAMVASGKFLLFIKSFINFDKLVLEESINELETSGEKISVSANNNFVLAERFHYTSKGGFGGLFGDIGLKVTPGDDQKNHIVVAGTPVANDAILPKTSGEILNCGFGSIAIKKLLSSYSFTTVLDIGCGTGEHTKIFREHNKVVTSIDIKPKTESIIVADYMKCKFNQQDCIWCCHVLEHQLNVNMFLKKIHKELKEDGILAVTVPPIKHQIVGGHVSLWNAGLLMYNLVLAGFDCSEIAIKAYGYDISALLKKKTIELPDNLNYDNGDLERLSEFFPDFVKQGFDGNITEYNWD